MKKPKKTIVTFKAKAQYSQYKSRGEKYRGLEFALSLEDFERLATSECYLCGEQATGFDRVDSGQGYVQENVLPCCGRCNAMKSDMVLSEFLGQVSKIMSHFIAHIKP